MDKDVSEYIEKQITTKGDFAGGKKDLN